MKAILLDRAADFLAPGRDPVFDATMLIGVISDTHGLLRSEALEALAGVEHMIHAGDIGSPRIVRSLQRSRRSPRSAATSTLRHGLGTSRRGR